MTRSKNAYIALGVVAVMSLALRIYFLLKPGYSFDIHCFLDWGGRIKEGGFWSLFSGNYYQNNGIDYPPLIPLVCSWWFSLVKNQTALYYKILPTIFELGLIAVNVFFIIKSHLKYKNLLLAVVVIQPALALVTSAWGQVDAIMSLLIITGFLFWEKNFYLSSVFLFLAFLAKPQAAIAIFIYFLCLFFRPKKKEFFRQVILFIILFAMAIAVFRLFGNSNFLDPYTKSVGRYTNISLNAFNLWWLALGEKAWDLHDTSGPYKNIGLLLFAIFEIPVLIYVIRQKITFSKIMLITAYSYLVFFIFPTQIHERYLFPAIALLAIPAIEGGIVFYLYLVLTATFFYNCFAVLESVYPQFSFVSGNLLTGDIPVIISFVNVLSVIFFTYYLINEAFRHKKSE